MLWIVIVILCVVACLPNAEDRERANRWQQLLDDIERKNKPLE